MPDIIDNIDIADASMSDTDIPVYEYPVISSGDTVYTDPTTSYWADPGEAGGTNNSLIVAKILRTNKDHGTMKVIGVHDDIYADVQIPSSTISKDHMGDVSLPSSESQVVLGMLPNGEYVPLTYIRPFSDEKAFGTGTPNELEEGDLGWETKDGGKLYMFENGMVQVESAPNCNRIYFPLDDGEKIQDVCREYDMVTDCGNIEIKRRSITDFARLAMEVPELAGSNPAPLSLLEMGALNDLNTQTGIHMKVYQSNVGGAAVDAASLKMQRTGQVDLDAFLNINMKTKAIFNIEGTKINLGGDTAIEPVPLGIKLQAEIEAIKTWCKAHFHPVSPWTTSPSLLPLATPGKYLSGTSFVK